MSRTNWITLALLLTGLSGMVGALHDWSEAFKPQFVGGVFGIGAAVINAAFGERPAENNPVSRAAASVVYKITGTEE